MTRDDLATRLLETFVGELEEQNTRLNEELLGLEREPRDAERLRAVFRIAHTLKGAARAAGLPVIEELCHAMETLLARARDGRLHLAEAHFTLLFETADALASAGAQLRRGEWPDGELADLRRRLRGGVGGEEHLTATPPRRALPVDIAIPASPGRTTPMEGSEAQRAREEIRHIRVHPEKLDALVASAGQLLISAGHGQSHSELARDVADLANRLQLEWRRSWIRARGAFERSGAPPRDVQALDALSEQVARVAAEAASLAEGARRDSTRLWRVAGDISERVRGLRMRPFADVVEVLPRLVRDVATRTGKQVELIVEGEEIEADRAVLEGLREAIVHLVRNAVDHGIEPTERRTAAGKPARGHVRVRAELMETGLRVTVHDDGGGLHVEAVRARLERRGIDVPESDRDVVELLFAGGISTRDVATEISGRGVGLDLVRAAVQRVRGSIDVEWGDGQGTTFTIDAPLTLATLRAVLVRSGRHLLAIPSAAIERLLRVGSGEVRQVEGRVVLVLEGRPVPLAPIAALLGPPLTADPPSEFLYVVLLRSGTREVAVSVDELLAEQEIMLRPLERLGAPRVDRLAGVAMLPSGRVALVVDIAPLLRGDAARAAAPQVPPSGPPERPRRVLVVDDSITTRLLEQTVLESAGYDVYTAVDGVEGWNLLQEHGADVVVTDVEMPRMDGIQLCEMMRASRRFRDTPVVLVTSLESTEYRQRGLEAGADAYIVKSSFDQETLLETIGQLLR